MKNKKAIIIVVILIIFVLIAGIVVASIKNKNLRKENKIPNRFVITYTYGGGFTTYANSLNRSIAIDQDGNVTISLTEEDAKVEPLKYSIKKSEAKALMQYFIDKDFEKVKKDLSDNNVTDLNTSYIEVKSDTLNRKVGGYAAILNSKFKLFANKVIDVAGQDRLDEFNNSVERAYEKSNS